MPIFHLTKMLSGGGGVYTSRLSAALRRSGVESRVLSLDDGSLVPPGGLAGKINARFDWALNGTINRRSRGAVLTYYRRQIWNPGAEIQSDDIVHLHSITGFIGDRGLRHLLRNRPRVFWTAHNPWLFTGGCVAYAGCDRFQSGCKRCPLLKFPLEGWTSRESKAKVKFWRDYGVKPIANSEWMAAMMRRSPRFEGMDIPVVPPIVDDTFTAKADSRKGTLRRIADDGGLRAEGKAALQPIADGGWLKTEGKSETLKTLDPRRSIDSAAPATLTSEATFGRLPRATPCAGGLDSSSALALVAGRSSLDSPMPRWAGGSRFVVGMSARSLTDGGKGIAEFLECLPLDRAFLKETTFVLIGEGKIRVPAGLDCRFPGHVQSPERLAEMYRSLDLFVSASAMETFGMAILEAQACGTPVVAFETGGTPEAVCPRGSKLVRHGDWAGLFREVEVRFERTMKGSGKNHELTEWVASRHSWGVIAGKQIEIYESRSGHCFAA